MTETSILNLLYKLFGSHAHILVDMGIELVKQAALRTQRAGMYAVERHETILELKNHKGSVAVHQKNQTIRFLQDNIIVYPDTAWGDGTIFADYRCSSGIPVDTYREGNRWRVLISLRKTMNRDDVEKIQIERTIKDGFTKDEESFQTEVNHFTDYLKLSVIFPASRLPKQVWLMQRNLATTQTLDEANRQLLSDGRQQYSWNTRHPRRFEAYILRWRW